MYERWCMMYERWYTWGDVWEPPQDHPEASSARRAYYTLKECDVSWFWEGRGTRTWLRASSFYRWENWGQPPPTPTRGDSLSLYHWVTFLLGHDGHLVSCLCNMMERSYLEVALGFSRFLVRCQWRCKCALLTFGYQTKPFPYPEHTSIPNKMQISGRQHIWQGPKTKGERVHSCNSAENRTVCMWTSAEFTPGSVNPVPACKASDRCFQA